MGSLRRGLILATSSPTVAMAGACDKVRPFWEPGAPATAWDELLGLMATPPSLVLIIASALAIRFRHQWGALAVMVLWTMWVSAVAFYGVDDEVQQLAIAEGCIGSPALFIGVVAAICVPMIIYTTPRTDRAQ